MNKGRLSISTKTRLYGVFANGSGERPIPVVDLIDDLIQQRGVDAIFVPFQVTAENLQAALAGMRCLRDFAGFCVAAPHKTTMTSLCDELLPNAAACGAVNAVRFKPGGRLIGEIFDGVGMVQAITAYRDLGADTRVLMIGAGGVGQAIAVALAFEGVGYLTITNRTQAKADNLAETIRRAVPSCTVESSANFDPSLFNIVINATPLGLNGIGPMPIDVGQVSNSALVADVVSIPERTELLQAAERRGLDIVRGREMMTPQIEAIADFLGITPAS
jgi:shikimate dehydrogenase